MRLLAMLLLVAASFAFVGCKETAKKADTAVVVDTTKKVAPVADTAKPAVVQDTTKK